MAGATESATAGVEPVMHESDATPAPVALLLRAETDAEGPVGLLRMLVAAGLGLFFLIAMTPHGALPDDPVLARQRVFAAATILAYFLLGLTTWVAVRRGWFRRWMIWPAAAADASFMTANVWLSLRNTGLTGDAAFLLPPVWLVPLVLAFGALRGNPRVMGFQTALICIGLGVIVAIGNGAPGDAGPDAAWLFLSLPSNLMRLGMIALAGAVLVVAALRAQGLLLRSIDAAIRSANLTRYLPEQVAGTLATSGLDALRRGRQGDMGILFVDIRDFTRWSQNRSPQEVSGFMTEFRRRVTRAARDTGGLIDKFIGDAAMILFVPGDDAQAAARASLECAAGICREIGDWNRQRRQQGEPPVSVGIGLHWGEVFSGVIGDAHRLEYTVFGDAVNVAARLERLTRDLDMETIVSRAALDRAGVATGAGQWVALDPVPVRGRDGTVAVVGRRAAPVV